VPIWLKQVLLVALFAVFAGRIVATHPVFNDTNDESSQIAMGLELLERGTYSIEAQHPPLARLVVAALPYWAGLRLQGRDRLWEGGAWSQAEPGFYWRTLRLGRAGNLVFAALLFLAVCAWSARIHGPRGSLVAGVLLACCPSVIAHASLATLDLAAAATLVAAAYALWRWTQEPGWRWLLAAGAAGSAAVLVKFSALPYLGAVGVMYFCLARGRRRRLLAGLPVLALVFLAMAWPVYWFQAGRPASDTYATRPLNRLARIPLAGRLLPYMFTEGVAEVAGHNVRGHYSYLLGKLSMDGWWYYFPVALAVKTPLPLLALVAVGVVRQRRNRDLLYPLLGVGAVLGIAMASRMNLGIRHVLAIEAWFAVLAAGAAVGAGRAGAVMVLALAGWHAAESVGAHPHYLAYFNQIARGREWRFLADSNLDWGQDLALLGRWMRERGVDQVQLSYFGATEPAKVGVKARPLRDGPPEPGWAAVSVNHLAGLSMYHHWDWSWYLAREPTARVGKSIWVYYRPPEVR